MLRSSPREDGGHSIRFVAFKRGNSDNVHIGHIQIGRQLRPLRALCLVFVSTCPVNLRQMIGVLVF